MTTWLQSQADAKNDAEKKETECRRQQIRLGILQAAAIVFSMKDGLSPMRAAQLAIDLWKAVHAETKKSWSDKLEIPASSPDLIQTTEGKKRQ